MTGLAGTRLEGAKDLDRLLRRLPAKVGKRVATRAVRQGANVIRDEAKRTAPRGTEPASPKYGRLADNIRVTKVRDGFAGVVMAVTVGQAFWGMFLEFGTSRQPARPWLRPAFHAKAGEAVAKMGTSLGKDIEKAALALAGPLAKSGLVKKKRRRR